MDLFEYVPLDDTSKALQQSFRGLCQALEADLAHRIISPRPREKALAALEEVYLWAVKAIANDQLVRLSDNPLNQRRGDE